MKRRERVKTSTTLAPDGEGYCQWSKCLDRLHPKKKTNGVFNGKLFFCSLSCMNEFVEYNKNYEI